MQDIRKLVIEVLEQGHLMSLATQDEGGLWVSDVIYVFDDDLNLYWTSSPKTRHSVAIENNSQVAGSVTVSNKSNTPNLGVQFSGTATKIEGDRFDLATKHFLKRNHPVPKETDGFLKGKSWYTLKPAFFDLINEGLFGFKKEKLILQ